jgi:sugar (pentulose or hexulose) kinase
MDLAVGLKLQPSFESAVADMTRISRTFEPIPENHKLYDDLYKRVYLKMYDRLAPFYKEIQDITGYPAKD